jgi:protocatechuate 3,4-dioxygenase beta subunit
MAIAMLLASVGFIGLAGDAPDAPKSIRVIVHDPDGKPLPGANVHIGIWTKEKDYKYKRDYETDHAGAARIELPKTFYILRLWASKKPFVSMFANWEQDELASGKGVPDEYTFRLEKAVTAGGRVLDEKGKPIAGAKVQVNLNGELKPVNSDGRTIYDTWLAWGRDAVVTDADGRWRITNVPSSPQLAMRLMVTHLDFVSSEI